MRRLYLLPLPLLTLAAGCASPYAADRGAANGALLGAGLGAVVGEGFDNPLAGAAIGALGGAVAGSSIGGEIDRAEARAVRRDRAILASATAARPGGVTIDEVLTMSASGVDPSVIATHVRQNGVARPPGTGDLITLQQNGVAPEVVAALQTAGPPAGGGVSPADLLVGPEPRPPVIIEEHHYGRPYYGPPPWYDPHCDPRVRYRRRRPQPGFSWGVTFSD